MWRDPASYFGDLLRWCCHGNVTVYRQVWLLMHGASHLHIHEVDVHIRMCLTRFVFRKCILNHMRDR